MYTKSISMITFCMTMSFCFSLHSSIEELKTAIRTNDVKTVKYLLENFSLKKCSCDIMQEVVRQKDIAQEILEVLLVAGLDEYPIIEDEERIKRLSGKS